MTTRAIPALQTLAEVDDAIAEVEQRLAQYRRELEDAEADGQPPARARELVDLAERQLVLLRERRQDVLVARILAHRRRPRPSDEDPSGKR